MALALCLTLLPTAALAEETVEGGAIVQEEQQQEEQEEAPAAESPAVSEQAAGAVAEVDGTTYSDLIAAFDEAQEKTSATVKLLADVATNGRTSSTHGGTGTGNYIFDQGNVTFDLNGHTLTWTKYDAYRTSLLVGKNGRLTVCDGGTDGKIYNENAQAINIYAGTLIIQSGTLMSESGKALKIDGGVVSITGGTVQATNYFGEGVWINPDTVNNKTATLTISGDAKLIGGTTGSGLYVARKSDENPVVKLSGGTYTGGSNGIECNSTTVGTLLDEGCRYMLGGSDVTDTGVSTLGSGVTVEANPNAPVKYIDADGNEARANCTEITAETWDISQGWHVVKENVTISGLNISGEVNLILCDGATLTVTSFMNVSAGSTLNLFWQSAGSGKLTAADISVLGTVTAPAGEMKQTDDSSGTTFEKCFEHGWEYTNNGDTHTATCKLCGKDGGAVNHSYTDWTDNSDGTHTGKCVCEATAKENHTPTYTPNADGLTHSTKCSKCGYTAAVESHNFNQTDDYGKKCACGAYLAAEYNGQQYATLARAIEAAKNGGTVTLQMDVGERITVNDGMNVTIDLNNNGWTTDGNTAHATLVVTGGSVTVQNGRLTSGTSSNAYTAVEVEGGKLTVGEDMTIQGGSMDADRQFLAIDVKGGELVLSVGAKLDGGLKVPEGKHLSDYLPEGTAFRLRSYDESTGTWTEDKDLLNAYTTNVYNIPNMALVVMEHTKHDFKLNSDGKYTCACGYTCPHNEFENGVCKICGNGCAHTNVDENGLCPNCKTQMAVKITASDNTVTYGTDFKAAMRNATNGTKITLLADVSIPQRTGISGDDTTVTLDLNGHKITRGWLDVGGIDTNGTYTACTLKIIGKGSYEPPLYGGIITVNMKATLDLSKWEGGTISSINISDSSDYEAATREAAVIVGPNAGTIGELAFGNNQLDELKKTKLSGGSFNEIWAANHQPVKLGELLADGYAFQNEDGPYVKYETTLRGASIFNVKVVKCPHAKINEDGHCAYCNATNFVAQVTAADGSSSAYTDIAAAIAAADGGTVKLLANAGEITISSPLKLDLNGKTAAKLTVTGDVTLASLLPEGYAFKSDTTWISDLSGTELTNVSMAKIPIKSMDYPTEMSMTYGGAGTLLVKVEKGPDTGAVSFQWYKVEGGKETAVGSATPKSQFNLAEQKLSAGKHIFRFSATCDGYEKMSKDIVITVQKADIRSSLITPPTAQENLTYTGQEQALITAGSVTDYGTMQYSLTENGTYSQDIPTGTDAGAYTVWYRVIGDENHNDTAPASVAVSIGKKPLTITGVTAASKPYDGTTNADISSVTFDGMNLNRGTDYTVTASFDDASAGNVKNVTATVTLMGQTAKNYVLEQSSLPTTGSITKADAPDFTKETTLVIVNGHEKTYTVTLPAMPTLETPKEYGALTYEISEIKLDVGYYTGGAKVENGKLTLPIQKNDVETTGSVGTVTVVIKSTNYEDITLTVNISAKNKLTPVLAGTLTLTPIKITYGEPLSKIKITGTMKAGDTVVEGTFSWRLPGNTILDASTSGHTVEWTFTPKDGNTYTEVTGTATVQVDKATQYGKVSMAGYTYGQTPSTPTLTNRTGDANAQVTYRYSAAGSGSVQTWDIQNPPALNAGIYRMYASIGDTDNYYGCEAVYCEFVVAKATPTYTAPTGLTAKYGQTLADVKLSNPEGNLDGTWSWMNSSESVGDASTVTKTFQAKFTPKDTENYNTVENIELEVMVNKADGRNLKTVELEQKYTDTSEHTYTPDWAGLPAGQGWTFSSEASIVLPKQDFAADGNLLTYAISGGKVGDKITITLKASCDNYEDFTITLTITLTAKDDQAALTLTGGTTVVYGQTLQLGTSGGNGNGAVTYAVTNGTGEATIDATGKLTPVKVGKVKVSATKAGDASYNSITSSPVEITITRAVPTGEPAYTKITASGKTLADAALGIGTITPAGGTIAWDDPTTTEVVANKSYGWTYTPTDTNYTIRTGTIKLWSKSSGGGSGRTAAVVAPDMPMLYRGYTGDAVKTLQEKLNAKGFDSGNVDGIFGAKTYAAVTAFQKANSLGVDGIVGKLTWAKLYDATPVNVTPVTTQPMLRTGSRGDAVRKLQEMLNAKGYTCGSVDGIFGSKTKAAVLAFQKANGLAADGIVGPLTWGKLV